VFEHERELAGRPDIPRAPPRPEPDVNTISAATVSTWR
jgi:hypothetical protein